MATQQQQANLSLLDMSIDDIDDLPGFEVPVNGIYTMKFSTGTKVINNKDCIESNFEVIECNEQNDPNEPATKAGTKFSMLTMLDNDIALGKFKELVAPIAVHFGERNLLKLVTDVCKDLIIVGKVKRRADKEDKEKFYASVTDVTVA